MTESIDGRIIDYQVTACPARRTAVIRAAVPRQDMASFFAGALRRVLEAMEKQGTIPAGEPFAYYDGTLNGLVHVEVGFPILGRFEPTGDVVLSELPAGKAVTGVHIGSSETLSHTYARLSTWATVHGLQPTGQMWEIYLTDPERELDPDRWRTGVFLHVA